MERSAIQGQSQQAEPAKETRHARPCAGHPRLRIGAARKTWMAWSSPAATKRETFSSGSKEPERAVCASGGVFQPLQRLEDFCLSRRRCLAFLFLFLDDFFGRIGDE